MPVLPPRYFSQVLLGLALGISAGSLRAAVVHVVTTPPVQTSPFIPSTFLDLDGNGVTELEISNGFGSLMLLPSPGNRLTVELEGLRVARVSTDTILSTDLDEDLLRWAGSRSPTLGPVFQSCFSNGAGRFCSGNFQIEPGYYGIEFDIAGELHYGWIRAVADRTFVISTTFEWAYEDVPGRPIAVGAIPEPSTGVLLFTGLAIFANRRRPRRS